MKVKWLGLVWINLHNQPVIKFLTCLFSTMILKIVMKARSLARFNCSCCDSDWFDILASIIFSFLRPHTLCYPLQEIFNQKVGFSYLNFKPLVKQPKGFQLGYFGYYSYDNRMLIIHWLGARGITCLDVCLIFPVNGK